MTDNQINIKSLGHPFKGQITDEMRDLVQKVTTDGVDLTKWDIYIRALGLGYYKEPQYSPDGSSGWVVPNIPLAGSDRTTLNFVHVTNKDFELPDELLALSEKIYNTPGLKSTIEVLQTGIDKHPMVEDGQVQYVWYKKNGVSKAYQAFLTLAPEMAESEFVFVFDDYDLDLFEKGEYDETRKQEMVQGKNGPYIKKKMKWVDSDKRDVKVTIIGQDIVANEENLIKLIKGLDDVLDD